MIEFGLTLRKAREDKGLTTKQVAEKTHMMVQMVEDLENENFSKIAAPIYGRGFVKLYCEAVGIEDPKPLVAEFMDIFNGNRMPSIRMKQSVPAAEPTPPPATAPEPAPAPETPPAPEPIPSPEPVPEPQSVPTPEPESAPEPAATPEPATEPESVPEENGTGSAVPPVNDDIFHLEQESVRAPAKPFASDFGEDEPPVRRPSRYVAPTPIDDDPDRPRFKISVPPAVWRLLALAVAAGLILWALLAGVRALYRLTMHAPEPSEKPASVQQAEAPAPGADKKSAPASRAAPRTPMDIPPLYID